MSIVSKFFNTRNIPVTLNIKGGDDDLLKGPLGYDVATAVLLKVLHDKNFIDTMNADDYNSFVNGNDVNVLVTERENNDVLRVMIQLGNGSCICGDELTDAEFRKKETVFTVGCVRKGEKKYNFVRDNHFNLQDVVHKCLLEILETAYGLKKDDPKFVDKLLALHWQYNPNEKPQPQQTTTPQQPQQPATSASAGVQTSNSVTTIGDFYFYNGLKLKDALVQNKDNTLITDANDSIMEAMAGDLMQATGIYLGVYGQENSESARRRKAAKLIGFEENQIDTLFGKKPKDNPDKDSDKKDADSAKTEDDELTKTEKYEYEVGFGEEPEINEGTHQVKLTRVQGALEAVKTTALAEGNSLARMYKLVRAWNTLECVIKEATDAGLDTVGMTCLHYRLSEADAFMLKIQGKKGLMPLCFGNEKKPQNS